MSIESTDSLSLPENIQRQLWTEQGLLLSSNHNTYILRGLKEHNNQLIQITIPEVQTKSSTLDLILTLILYGSICGVLALWLLPLTRRLSKLTTAASKFGSGNLSARVATSKLSYITQLEVSFNQMASQIEELIAENKLLADSLSHDLRTPLACLRFGIDAALDEPNIDKKNSYIERLEQELTRMEEMLSAFLEYASIERQRMSLQLTSVNLHQLITELINECQPIALQANVEIDYVTAEENIIINADHHWLYRALMNLLTNGIRYSSNHVQVSVWQSATTMSVCIADDGPGIPSDQQAEIFKPFIKLDKSRARNDGNFGLGLAIVNRIADWHHGSVNVRNHKILGGAEFRLVLPKT